MAREKNVALAEAVADQLGIDMTPKFLIQIDLIQYRLFLRGFSVRPLRTGPSRPPAAFVFPPADQVTDHVRANSDDLAKPGGIA